MVGDRYPRLSIHDQRVAVFSQIPRCRGDTSTDSLEFATYE